MLSVSISTILYRLFSFFFFFNDTATTEIYTLSLHDALPISWRTWTLTGRGRRSSTCTCAAPPRCARRSEEHTSELQSPCNLVCRLLLEKKKQVQIQAMIQLKTNVIVKTD